MKRARKYVSPVSKRIREKQNPTIAARARKKLIISAIIADALEDKNLSKGKLASDLDKYASEITKWTSGSHNFTIDTLSDIEEILGIQILPSYEEFKQTKNQTLHCTLLVEIKEPTVGIKKISKEDIDRASIYIANSGGILPTHLSIK